MPAPASIRSSAATEDARLAALHASHVLDTAAGPGLEGLVRLSASLFRVPYVFVVLVDRERLFFKASLGVEANELPRAHSFCEHMVESHCLEPLVVADARQDERFSRDSLVAGRPFLRFLAAAPLITSEGHRLGAFCIGSHSARVEFTHADKGALADLAELAMVRIGSAKGAAARTLPGQREQRLFRLARLDPLTELADHEAFADELARQSLAGAPFALLLLNIDGFRQISTTLDRQTADRVLKTLARRLCSLFQEATIVARLGGDEFAVILKETSPDDLRHLCRLALQTLADPLDADGTAVSVSTSMGVAVCPGHGMGQTLLGHADLALYEAKRKGTQLYRFFSDDLEDAVIRRKKTESELRHAFTNRQFEIRFQPQFDLATRKVVGAEALLRWHHPVRGLTQPGDFLDVLETSPSIARVGAWILSSACDCAVRWRQNGMPDFRIAVNLFPAQVHSGHLQALVMDALAASGLPPEALELEITENTLLKPDAALVESLGSLRRAGVGIALDDYGTGYASLSLLKRLPVSRLKIDRSFVSSLPGDAEDAAVVQAVLFLGRQFGLSVVAEGIETPEQEAFLQEQGCHEGQGYLYSEALPEAEFFTRYVAPSASQDARLQAGQQRISKR